MSGLFVMIYINEQWKGKSMKKPQNNIISNFISEISVDEIIAQMLIGKINIRIDDESDFHSIFEEIKTGGNDE